MRKIPYTNQIIGLKIGCLDFCQCHSHDQGWLTEVGSQSWQVLLKQYRTFWLYELGKKVLFTNQHFTVNVSIPKSCNSCQSHRICLKIMYKFPSMAKIRSNKTLSLLCVWVHIFRFFFIALGVWIFVCFFVFKDLA